VRIDTGQVAADEAASIVIEELRERGLLGRP